MSVTSSKSRYSLNTMAVTRAAGHGRAPACQGPVTHGGAVADTTAYSVCIPKSRHRRPRASRVRRSGPAPAPGLRIGRGRGPDGGRRRLGSGAASEPAPPPAQRNICLGLSGGWGLAEPWAADRGPARPGWFTILAAPAVGHGDLRIRRSGGRRPRVAADMRPGRPRPVRAGRPSSLSRRSWRSAARRDALSSL